MAKKQTIAAKKKDEKKETWLEFIASMAVVLVIGLFIITFILQAFEIPSASMEDTLLIGDHLFVDRVAYAPSADWVGPLLPYRQVRRGDIVVFLSPSQPGLYVVKRIIGVPGDRVRLRNGVVYLNGQPQPESYVKHGDKPYDPFRDDFPVLPFDMEGNLTPEWRRKLGEHVKNGELVVPGDSYFAMGDNRQASYDSRYWGFIPRENVIGRPMFIYWSFQTPAGQYNKTSIGERVAFILRVIVHFFDQTRWDRMLHPVR